jgi:hypothetical protein
MNTKRKWFSIFLNQIFSDLGCHLDGFIAVAAHTFVVGASKVTFSIK